MKYRDKLAHWCWGYSNDLPDALLLREPSDKLLNLADYVNLQQLTRPVSADLPINFNHLYVLTESDLGRALNQLTDTQHRLLTAIGSVWEKNTPLERERLLHQLAETPLVRTALNRLAANRTKQEAPPQSPEPKQNGGS
jgi:hypothetical protein